jgi:hypothetical protein
MATSPLRQLHITDCQFGLDKACDRRCDLAGGAIPRIAVFPGAVYHAPCVAFAHLQRLDRSSRAAGTRVLEMLAQTPQANVARGDAQSWSQAEEHPLQQLHDLLERGDPGLSAALVDDIDVPYGPEGGRELGVLEFPQAT